VGNAALILLFGGAILRVLRRFKRRFGFELEPEVRLAGPAQEPVV